MRTLPLCFFVLLTASSLTAVPPQYVARRSSPQTHSGAPQAINNKDEVITVGSFGSWLVSSGAPTELTTADGTSITASDLNAEGAVAGSAPTRDGYPQPFVVTAEGVAPIGIGGFDYCTASSLNDYGVVAGTCWASQVSHAVAFRRGMPRRLFRGDGTASIAINRGGDVLVSHGDEELSIVSGTSRLPIDGGGRRLTGFAMNALGDVAGRWRVGSSEVENPFVLIAGAFEDFTRFGWESGTATDINDLGEAVGWVENQASGKRSFLYAGGELYDLQSITVPVDPQGVIYAAKINDRGVIAAIETHPQCYNGEAGCGEWLVLLEPQYTVAEELRRLRRVVGQRAPRGFDASGELSRAMIAIDRGQSFAAASLLAAFERRLSASQSRWSTVDAGELLAWSRDIRRMLMVRAR